MPRSPRWLAGKDRWEEATKVLARLHAQGNQLDPLIVAEVQEIRERLQWVDYSLASSLTSSLTVRGWNTNLATLAGWRY